MTIRRSGRSPSKGASGQGARNARVMAPLPWRQVHLDFHTSPDVPDVGVEFEPREFARVMKRAQVNSVTVFAKCHHGHLYYRTRRPERHPGLSMDLDLLAGQVEALHREGIRAPIYISVQCDEYAANTHPEWIALNADSSQVKWGGRFIAGWQILDMASPYQEYLAEQTREILKAFKPVDGIFFDMCWDQPSCSAASVTAMQKQGLDPEQESIRKAFAHQVALDYMKRFHAMVRDESPAATVYFNSRPLSNLAEEITYMEQVEIEALPTGGWGYMYFPKNVRFARTFPKPYLGMTARFHKSWADFGGLKPYPALEYETSQMIASGARCSIGDQLHPRGRLDAAAYELIGKAYQRVAEREPWLSDAKPASEIGLFQVPSSAASSMAVSGSDEGATRLLTQLRHQFDVVHPDSDLGPYRLLILPDGIDVTPPLAQRLSRFLADGGRILASGTSGLTAQGDGLKLEALGIRPQGPSPYQASYIRFSPEISQDVPATDHICYDRTIRVRHGGGTRTVARVVEPYFDRRWDHFSSHNQTPGATLSVFAAAVLGPVTAYIAFPVFSSFANHGNIPYRLLVRNLLQHLLPDQMLTVGGPSGLEASVAHQGKRTIIHLLYYAAERRTAKFDIIEDIIPLRDIPLSLLVTAKPRRVCLVPEGRELPFEHRDGRLHLTVPDIVGHAMLMVE